MARDVTRYMQCGFVCFYSGLYSLGQLRHVTFLCSVAIPTLDMLPAGGVSMGVAGLEDLSLSRPRIKAPGEWVRLPRRVRFWKKIFLGGGEDNFVRKSILTRNPGLENKTKKIKLKKLPFPVDSDSGQACGFCSYALATSQSHRPISAALPRSTVHRCHTCGKSFTFQNGGAAAISKQLLTI